MKFNYKILRRIRNNHGKSQTELAKYLGLSRSGYGHKETGVNPISIDQLDALSHYYGIDLADFFSFDGSENSSMKGGEKNMDFEKRLSKLENELNYYRGIIEGFRMAGHDIPPFAKGEISRNSSNGET